ncbi:DUF3828 domain-containing protein [Pluralibacter gergoviae]
MKLLAHKLSVVFIFPFSLLFSNVSLADESKSPESIVHNFYSAYLQPESGGNDALIKTYVSDELAKSIHDSIMCNYDTDDSISEPELANKCSRMHECKQDKGNFICSWYGIWVETDVNYFTKSQDVFLSWRMNINTFDITQKGGDSLVHVVLGDGSEPKAMFEVSLKKDDGNWKIISVTK